MSEPLTQSHLPAVAVPATAVVKSPEARELLIGTRLRLTVVDRVAHLELARPQSRNAMDPAFVNEMVAALDAIEADGAARALLITAQGPSFCVGGDLKYFVARPESHAEDFGWMVDNWHQFLGRLAQVQFPVIAAVHGGTAGGGLGFVWCADHVIAAESTRMAGGFADIGLSGDGGASWHLPRLVGLRRAQSMLLDNEMIDARQALDWGIINHVVPDAELEASAWEAARRFAKRSATAFSRAKSLLLESSTNGYLQHLEAEARAIHECAAESDVKTGILAFAARQPAVFTDPYRHAVQL